MTSIGRQLSPVSAFIAAVTLTVTVISSSPARTEIKAVTRRAV
jgi:hypothetical protein